MAWCKMMPRGVGIISTPGQAIFENSLLDTIFEPLLTFVDLCWFDKFLASKAKNWSNQQRSTKVQKMHPKVKL